MKGVILAGGSGTRLYPLTKVTNKNLLPVGKKPILQHCIERLTEANIRDILIISGKEQFGQLAAFVGSGADFRCNITLKVQDKPKGIAHAVGLTKGFIREDDRFCVLLGDNLFEEPIGKHTRMFEKFTTAPAQIILKWVSDPERFGCPEFDLERKIVRIEEKPEKPKSNYAIIGLYFYDHSVFSIIDNLKPSDRGELEISDVNQIFLERGQLQYSHLDGDWVDAGTFESLKKANELAEKMVYLNDGSVKKRWNIQ